MSLLLLFNAEAATSGPRRRLPTPPRFITVFDPFWTNPRPLAVANLEMTWAVDQPGRLSCFLPVADAHRFGVDDWIGLWVYYEHPTQGPWGGAIEDEPATLEEGTLELAASGMKLALLSGRAAPILARPESGYAGALFRRALSLVQMSDPLPITSIAADESGPPLEVEHRGDNLYDLGAALAQQSGQEFDLVVNADRTIDLAWREQLGTDTDVLLAEGYQVAGGRIDRSRVALVNEIIGLAANEDYARSSQARAESAASIERFRGRRQVVRRYEGIVTAASVKARVLADLRREQDATYLLTVTLPAMHPVCLDIRHGDRLRYWSHAKNRELDCRVLSRTVRDGTVLELAMEGTEVRLPTATLAPPFTPDMISGLFAWWDADDASMVTVVNGFVIDWRDKSGNGHHLTHAAVDADPTYQPNAHNGRAVVRFDGVNDTLRILSLDLSSTDDLTVVAVAKRASSGATNNLVNFGSVGVAAGSWQIQARSTNKLRARLTGNVGDAGFETTATWTDTDYHVISATYDMGLSTDEVTLWFDGVSTGTRPDNANNTGSFSAAATFNVSGSGFFWNGDIAEVIIYDRALSATHRQAVEAYVGAKYGIAVGGA